MEEPAPGGNDPTIRDLADSIMGKVQLITHGLKYALADHLLDGLRRLALVRAARRVEQREVEPARDDRGHCSQLLAPHAEPVEPPGDEIADARGKRRRAGLFA